MEKKTRYGTTPGERDSECELFSSSDESQGLDIAYSDDDTESIDSQLSDANSIIDDAPINSTTVEDLYTFMNSNRSAEINSLDLIAEALSAPKDDCELSAIKNQLGVCNQDEKLLTLYLMGVRIDELLRVSSVDDVIRQLPVSQTSGFSAAVKLIDPTIDDKQLNTLLDTLSKFITNYRAPKFERLKNLGNAIMEYFTSDLLDDIQIAQLFPSRLAQLLSVMSISVNQYKLDTLVSVERSTLNNQPVKSVKLFEKCNTSDQTGEVYSLDDLINWECGSSTDVPTVTSHFTKKRNSKQKDTCQVIEAWKGDSSEQEACNAFQRESAIVYKYKSLTANLSAIPLSHVSQCVNHLTNQMQVYCKLVSSLQSKSNCDINTARKWAVNILDTQNRCALKTIMENDKIQLSQQDNNQSQIMNSSAVMEESTLFPDNDTAFSLLVTSTSDQRFLVLPVGWKLRDGYPAGLFQEVPELSRNIKNILLVAYGGETCVQFVEYITDFLRFNATSHRIAKSGIYAVVSSRDVMNNIPLVSVCYIVLTMGRSSGTENVLKELAWFIKLKKMSVADFGVFVFNIPDHFRECYKEVDEMRRDFEGGFIGAVDVKLRKSLKISDDDEEKNKAFQIIFEHFDMMGITDQPAAVSLMNSALNNPDSSEFKSAVTSIMASAAFAKHTVNIAIWWNRQSRMNMPAFARDNKGLVTFKVADQLFSRIRKLYGGHLLDPTVNIEDWDESTMGEVKYKGTLRQPAILDLIQQLRTDSNNLLYILKKNKISPTTFYNIICNKMVTAMRRDRVTILHGPKRSGKSIVAGALSSVFDGMRLAADVKGGRDFRLDATTDSTVGMALMEDVQRTTFKEYIDKQLRPYVDGDTVVVNLKMQATSLGSLRSVLITTNELNDSDSDDDTVPMRDWTLHRKRILEKRYSDVKFRTPLTAEDLFVEKIETDDVLSLFWRYGLFPLCNQLCNGPICEYSPCTGLDYDKHHFMCPLVREIHSNVQFSVSMSTSHVDDVVHEYYERVESSNLGITFDIKNAEGVRKTLEWHYRASLDNIKACKNEQLMNMKITMNSQINQFMEFVYKPLCYLSSYMRGNYLPGDLCKWAHANMLSHQLFKPILNQDLHVPNMGDLSRASDEDVSDLMQEMTSLPWCALVTNHNRFINWSNPLLSYSDLLKVDKNRLLIRCSSIIKASANKKRFTRGKNVKIRSLQKLVADVKNCREFRLDSKSDTEHSTSHLNDSAFNAFWVSLIGVTRTIEKSLSSQQSVDVAVEFFD